MGVRVEYRAEVAGSGRASGRGPGGFGQNDLYVSFRMDDGSWSLPEYCPMGTWDGAGDGRWLSFSRRDGPWATATTGDVFWIDARVLERLR